MGRGGLSFEKWVGSYKRKGEKKKNGAFGYIRKEVKGKNVFLNVNEMLRGTNVIREKNDTSVC